MASTTIYANCSILSLTLLYPKRLNWFTINQSAAFRMTIVSAKRSNQGFPTIFAHWFFTRCFAASDLTVLHC